jgi:hypothetical protein
MRASTRLPAFVKTSADKLLFGLRRGDHFVEAAELLTKWSGGGRGGGRPVKLPLLPFGPDGVHQPCPHHSDHNIVLHREKKGNAGMIIRSTFYVNSLIN